MVNKTKLLKLADFLKNEVNPEMFMNTNSKVLLKYISRKKLGRIGLVVAFREGEEILFGWSLCNFKMGDKFSREEGFWWAKQRAVTIKGLAKKALAGEIPQSVSHELGRMVERAEHYFRPKAVQAARCLTVDSGDF